MTALNTGLWHPFTPMRSFLRQRRTIVSALGHHVVDHRGRRLLDATSGIWNVPLGYGIASVHEAMVKQAATLSAASLSGTIHAGAEQLADQLTALLPSCFSKVLFGTDGSEAVEIALKLARQFHHNTGKPNKTIIIGLTHSYHGVSYGALSVSGIDKDKEPFEPLLPDFDHISAPYCYRCPLGKAAATCQTDCAALLEERILHHGADRVAAIMLEPVLGYGGVLVPPDDYLQKIQAICKRHNVLMILDEVTTGFGRTGKTFACEHSLMWPDIITLGKGIAAGYAPLSAVAVQSHVADGFRRDLGRPPFLHAGDAAGHPICVAAGNAFLQYIAANDSIAQARPLASYLQERLMALSRYSLVGDIRAKGLMVAIELVEDRETRQPLNPSSLSLVLRGLFASDVWLQVYGGSNTIIVSPALNFPREGVDQVFACLNRVLSLVDEDLHNQKKRRSQNVQTANL